MRPYLSTLRIVGIFAATLLPLVALAVVTLLQVVHNRVHCPAPLLVVCGYFMLVHAITYPELHFSEPLHPILVTIIAAAVNQGNTHLSEPLLTLDASGITRREKEQLCLPRFLTLIFSSSPSPSLYLSATTVR